nr:MAG TPA: hypothetical protein [Caudoviricetes sp.]
MIWWPAIKCWNIEILTSTFFHFVLSSMFFQNRYHSVSLGWHVTLSI